MKHLTNILFIIAIILAVVFSFMLFWQKQQNLHTEKMMAQMGSTQLQPEQGAITIPALENTKTLGQKMRDGAQSIIAFFLGIFTKL